MPYTSLERVQRATGVDFTADQAAEAHALLGAADAWIDARTGRTWGGGSTPVTGETHTLYGDFLYLKKPPVVSVQSVEVRTSSAGALWAAAPIGGWELADPASGYLVLPWGHAGWWARVAYTPAQVVDPRISLAATRLVAHWLTPVLSGGGGGSAPSGVVKRYSLGQELSVEYDTAATAAIASGAVSDLGVPTEVVGIVDGLREVFIT